MIDSSRDRIHHRPPGVNVPLPVPAPTPKLMSVELIGTRRTFFAVIALSPALELTSHQKEEGPETQAPLACKKTYRFNPNIKKVPLLKILGTEHMPPNV